MKKSMFKHLKILAFLKDIIFHIHMILHINFKIIFLNKFKLKEKIMKTLIINLVLKNCFKHNMKHIKIAFFLKKTSVDNKEQPLLKKVKMTCQLKQKKSFLLG